MKLWSVPLYPSAPCTRLSVPLVSFLIPVCTGPESAFQIMARRSALTAASQADANVNSLQQMTLGNASMSVTKLKWLDYTSKENIRNH